MHFRTTTPCFEAESCLTKKTSSGTDGDEVMGGVGVGGKQKGEEDKEEQQHCDVRIRIGGFFFGSPISEGCREAVKWKGIERFEAEFRCLAAVAWLVCVVVKWYIWLT